MGRTLGTIKKQLFDPSMKIAHTPQPVLRSHKICEDLNIREPKPPLIIQQWTVYNYQCDLIDAEYVGYTSRHLHQSIDKHHFSAISKFFYVSRVMYLVHDIVLSFIFNITVT